MVDLNELAVDLESDALYRVAENDLGGAPAQAADPAARGGLP